VASKIIRTARQTILKLLEGYSYKEIFHKKLLENKTRGGRRVFKTDYLWKIEKFTVFKGEKLKIKLSLKGLKKMVEFECRIADSS